MKLKERRKRWLKRVLSTTKEERKTSWWKKLMRKMSNINARTYTGTIFIGRNDPCICGNVYEGTVWRDKKGHPILNSDGKIQDKPVKFKHCCMKKYIGLKKGETTPALVEFIKRQTAYFNKNRRLPE